MREAFASSSIYVRNQMPVRKLQSIVWPRDFLHELFRRFNGLLEPVMWSDFSENCFDFSWEFSQFQVRYGWEVSIINLSRYKSKSYASVVRDDSEVTFLSEEEDASVCSSLYCILFIYSISKSKKSSNFFVFFTSGRISSRPAAFQF